MNTKLAQFYALIDSLISLNLLHRKSTDKIKRQLPVNIYLKQFCTIKCDIGRLVGKTSYIKQHADEKSLVIVCNHQMVDYLICDKIGVDVVSAKQIKNGFLDEKQPYEKIFIDEPKFVFKQIPEDDIYKKIATIDFYNQIVIQLGA